MLEVCDLAVGYGHGAVVRGVSLRVDPHRVVALVGPNGAGKTTLARCVAGYLRPASGRVQVRRGDTVRVLTGRRPWEVARAGVVYVPESGHIFPSLTVADNLGAALSSFPRPVARAHLPAAWETFPALAPLRRQPAGTLSGGEARLLGIARAVLFARALAATGAGGAPVLLLDEPSSGLSPVALERVAETLRALARDGWSMLLVEQMAPFALALADAACVMARGEVVAAGPPEAIRADERVRRSWLGGAAPDGGGR
ncbi:MAG TPA: ATP-binding cassette domain-containing protein [Longimicrobium sp.]|nr:ATP-binding cassette domain-containing protein [Longimicrobium sp.]